MCRSLSSRMVLSYVLKNHSSVSEAELMEKRNRLIKRYGDVLADVSYVSMRGVVHGSSGMLRMSVSKKNFKVFRQPALSKSVSVRSGLLSECYMDAYMSGYFSKDEVAGIKQILEA